MLWIVCNRWSSQPTNPDGPWMTAPSQLILLLTLSVVLLTLPWVVDHPVTLLVSAGWVTWRLPGLATTMGGTGGSLPGTAQHWESEVEQARTYNVCLSTQHVSCKVC